MDLDNKAKLQKFFDEGIIQEIFVADESYNILQTVKKRWREISSDNYGIFFKSLNHAHFIRYSLSITKLFDREHSKYDIISLPTVVNFIDENLLSEEIQNIDLTSKWFFQRDKNHVYSSSVSSTNLLKLIVEYYKKEIPTGKYTGNIYLERSLEIMRFYRDKIYAHREDVDTSFFPKDTLQHGQTLLNFAKSFVSIFELAIFNALYSTDGEDYILSRDSVMTNNAFTRLLESSKLIKEENYDC